MTSCLHVRRRQSDLFLLTLKPTFQGKDIWGHKLSGICLSWPRPWSAWQRVGIVGEVSRCRPCSVDVILAAKNSATCAVLPIQPLKEEQQLLKQGMQPKPCLLSQSHREVQTATGVQRRKRLVQGSWTVFRENSECLSSSCGVVNLQMKGEFVLIYLNIVSEHRIWQTFKITFKNVSSSSILKMQLWETVKMVKNSCT